jgi:hypothetical protein
VATRTLALIGLLCLGTAATVYTPPVEARTYVDVDVDIAPPAPRYEQVVVRRGYVWAPGYYRWEGGRHVWVGGSYMRERPGHRWVPAHWAQGPHGRWHFYAGHWS